MGLKEELERRQMEQNTAQNRREQCKKMYEEIYGRIIPDAMGYDSRYTGSLPVQLSPEQQAVVDEFVELCPQSEWEDVPAMSELEHWSFKWEKTYGGAQEYSMLFCILPENMRQMAPRHRYDGVPYDMKVRFSDGSIHHMAFDTRQKDSAMSLEELVGHPIKLSLLDKIKGIGEKSKAREEIIATSLERKRKELENLQKHAYGTQKSVCLEWVIDDEYRKQKIYIFQDKAIFSYGGYRNRDIFKTEIKYFSRLFLEKLERMLKR